MVAHVETPAHQRLRPEARDQVVQTLRLAERLGAETVTLTGQNPSDPILAHARERNVTRIVVGKPGRRRWARVVLGSIVDALVEGSGDIDVYVVSGERDEPAPAAAPRRRVAAPAWPPYGWAVAVVAAATGVAWAMFPRFELANLVMVYLLGIVVVARRHGRGPALLASVLSVAALDVCFVPPRFTFAVSDVGYAVTFAVMFVVALAIGGLTARLRAQAERASQRERRTAALYAMSRELAGTRGVEPLLATAARHLVEVFRGPVAVLLPDGTGRLAPVPGLAGAFDPETSDLAVAQWAFDHRQAAGLGTATLPGAASLYLPLLASRGAVGAIGLRPSDPHAFAAPEPLHQLETFANQMALALERAQLADEAQEARVRAETERLRNALLSAVSHDLRTPLATITGASATLLQDGARLDDEVRRELLASIQDEAERLSRLVQNLLEMTQLESGARTLRREWHSLEEVIGAALRRLGDRLAGRPIHVRVPPDLPLVPMDDVLIEQVIVNLLDNAAKYTPPGGRISILATATDQTATVEVADRGPGLPRGDEERVFEKFYRGAAAGRPGTGLGLAICRGIVQAHGGRIWAQNLPEGGAAFLFTLPIPGPAPAVAGDA